MIEDSDRFHRCEGIRMVDRTAPRNRDDTRFGAPEIL